MSILSALSRYTEDYRARRRRMRTYMEIANLPAEIRKDIGWGSSDDARDRTLRHLQQLGR